MTSEVPIAKWDLLFQHIPVAIRQLRSHDANCALEAAELFEAAYELLHCWSPNRGNDILVHHIGSLAGLMDRPGNVLEPETSDFVQAVFNGYVQWEQPRETETVVRELSLSPGREQNNGN
jgi:hypothetical protein